MKNISKANKKSIFPKIPNILDNIYYSMFFVFIISILSINLFSNEDYIMKQNFHISNIILLISGLFAFSILIFFIIKYNHINININKLTLILFLCVAYISFNISFQFNWDNYTVVENAKIIAGGGDKSNLNNLYFSVYPNNFFLLILLTFIFKLHNVIGIFTENNNYMPIILVQCLIMSLSAKVLYEIIYDFTKKQLVALVGFIVYSFSVVLSGWSVIIYTDQFGLIIPLLVLRIYQLLQNKNHILLKLIGITILSFIAIIIKPTLIIPTIAIVIYELIHNIKKINLQSLKYFLCMVLSIIIMSTSYSFIVEKFISYSGMNIDRNASVSPWHYIMMGLNEETQGTYSSDDVIYTIDNMQNPTKTSEQKSVIQKRLNNLVKSKHMLKHLHKKALNSFNDGTFFWCQRNDFVREHFENLNNHIAPLLKSLYLGRYKKIFQQSIWITVLFLSLFSVFLKKKRELSVMILSIIGYVIFIMTFEAAPRHLINFISYFIILALLIINSLCDRLNARFSKIQA